jgi:arginyl-tRNA--protein-N-Asp/Glu arginylyltransferase
MKVFFDHIEGFGKVKHIDFIFSNPYGLLEPGESASNALKEGWIPWGEQWFNLRSVRLNVGLYSPSSTVKKLSKRVTTIEGDMSKRIDDYLALYESYCSYHGFARDIEWSNFSDCQVIEYHYNNKLIGVSLYKVYDDQFVAMQFIWDYVEPKLSLGNIAQMVECKLAAELDCTYVYILGGYEQCCLYKSSFKGFEFWTGTEWSNDTELYKKLVERDERIVIKIEDEDI